MCRALIGGSVGHRIGKRHAQLDDIRAARFELAHQRRRGIEIGISGDDEWNQRAFVSRTQFFEFARRSYVSSRTSQTLAPRAPTIVCISLSPRPDRLMIITWSLRIVGASFAAYATACELSSAGMIPSVSESNFSPSSASASVTATYDRATALIQIREFWSDSRIIKARRDRVRLANLPKLILQQVGFVAM